MTNTGLHISISAEELFHLGSLPVSNSILTSLLVSTLLITFAIIVRFNLTNTSHPKGWQNFAEWLVESLQSLVHSITNNDKKTKQFLPWIATFLLFILVNNWLGLFPGVGTIGFKHLSSDGAHTAFVPLFRPGTADLNTTIALAIISVLTTQIMGVSHLGIGYFKKYINFSSPIMFFVGFLELISEIAKVISFAFRLFGNIFAGEVLLVVISFLLPILAPLPFYGLEVFVGFIQALVFSMLSLVFFNMATQSHDNH